MHNVRHMHHVAGNDFVFSILIFLSTEHKSELFWNQF